MNTLKKFIIGDKINAQRSSFFWNMLGSMLMAFQSVIMLMILTRTVGLVDAGIFTIAYATANLFLTIGKFGMRNYQASDVLETYKFGDYKLSRIITSFLMIIVSIIYIALKGYVLHKSLIVLVMCLFKVIDALEDVYHGELQQKGRLDIAAKSLSIRLLITLIIFAYCLIVTNSLLIALVAAFTLTTILFCVFLVLTDGLFEKSIRQSRIKKTYRLLVSCFPLFAGSFFSFYIGNAPKYAIDIFLSEEMQACYGFIAMPVFVIGLMNGFIFNPILNQISVAWYQKNYKYFNMVIKKQVFIVSVITLVSVLGAYILGIPVLSLVYDVNLSGYKEELIILLFGGGFLAYSGFLNIIITIIRFQKCLVWGYALVALLAYILSPIIVSKYEIMGASILYMILMAFLCIIFTILLVYGMIRNKDVVKREKE